MNNLKEFYIFTQWAIENLRAAAALKNKRMR